jgi:hypothetical protein
VEEKTFTVFYDEIFRCFYGQGKNKMMKEIKKIKRK